MAAIVSSSCSSTSDTVSALDMRLVLGWGAAPLLQLSSPIPILSVSGPQAQAEDICECPPEVVQRIEMDLKWALERRFNLEKCAAWLQRTLAKALSGVKDPAKEVRFSKASHAADGAVV